ncbi:EamA family transporter [Oscillibacter sp.]|uniref:EamA family transporter n=1 Tax=Oscillibacter sp. TaxID=1945593 RepID=UPI0028A09446|nr:EamA family transporter [Oscillibacter sp.]
MPFSMIWPIALVVLSNVFYNVCSKETPAEINPFAALTVTYVIGAAFSALMYFALNRGGSLFREYQNINWSSFVLGFAVVGLEAGSIYMYKAGWNVSSGQLVYSSILAVCLILVGVLAYHETISHTKIVGILVCMLGLFLINK